MQMLILSYLNTVIFKLKNKYWNQKQIFYVKTMYEKLHMKNISVVLLECKGFNESLGKTQQVSGDISRNEWFFSEGDSKIRSSYLPEVLFQLIMHWCHALADVQFNAKYGMPVLFTVKSLANPALILMSHGSDFAI